MLRPTLVAGSPSLPRRLWVVIAKGKGAGKTNAIRGNRVVVLRSLAANHAEGGTGAGAGLSWGKLTRLQGTPRRGKVTPESSLSPWRGPTFRDLPTHSDRSGSASTLMRLLENPWARMQRRRRDAAWHVL